jgi:hypothetical protein
MRVCADSVGVAMKTVAGCRYDVFLCPAEYNGFEGECCCLYTAIYQCSVQRKEVSKMREELLTVMITIYARPSKEEKNKKSLLISR